MASMETMHEEETTPVVGVGPAPGAQGNQPTVVVPPCRHDNPNPNQVSEAAAAAAAIRAAAMERIVLGLGRSTPITRNPRGWRRLAYMVFPPRPIYIGQPLDAQQLQMLQDERESSTMPGYFERLARDRKLVTECLHHYNSKNPGNEYEPAPGVVIQHFHFHNGICWTHGNFVARQKRSGCFSFLPAPRTLFFFELAYRDGFDGVVTCTPLDEPVTEAYSVLGFPLWWSTRRSGKLDSICKTCCRRFDVPHPGIRKIFACGHSKVEKVCQMCYLGSNVLHPYPGEFAFGYHEQLLSTAAINHGG